MPRTLLSGKPNCLAIRRIAALSQAKATASSKRLLNGALIGNYASLGPAFLLAVTPLVAGGSQASNSTTRDKVGGDAFAGALRQHRRWRTRDGGADYAAFS